MEALLWVILGCLIGGAFCSLLAWLLAERKSRTSLAWSNTELSIAKERQESATRELSAVQDKLESFRQQVSALQQDRASLLAQLEAEKKNILEQQQQFAEARARLRESFAELSVEALRKNSQQFFELADQNFKTLQAEAAGSLEQKKTEMSQLLTPMMTMLNQYKEKLAELEVARTGAYTSLEKQLTEVATTQQNLSKETTQLVQALKKPQGRGRWGELTLRRLFELAGMAEHVTFEEQVSVDTEEGKIRPDCIVHLPEERQVIVDSKCVLLAFLEGAAVDDQQRPIYMARHARQVRDRMNELSSKAYWESFEKSTDYVVLFLPGEAFLYAAVEHDPTLIEDALSNRVIIASPTTLLGLLRVIEHAWRQKSVEANATEIRNLGADLYERIQVMAEHFQKLGESINRVGTQYNKAIGSLERNVLPAARRMAELGVSDMSKQIVDLEESDPAVRELSQKSWKLLAENKEQ